MHSSRIFISYVQAEAGDVAEPLAQSFRRRHFGVWLDRKKLLAGASLSGEISQGLTECNVGVVIFTESYTKRPWTSRELGAFLARESAGSMDIYVLLHGVDVDYFKRECPLLADRIAVSTSGGIEQAARELSQAIRCKARLREFAECRAAYEALKRSRVERSPGKVRLVYSYGELLACWDRVETVLVVGRDLRHGLLLENRAAGIFASLSKLINRVNRPTVLTLAFFILNFLWIVGHWLAAVIMRHLKCVARNACGGRGLVHDAMGLGLASASASPVESRGN